MALVATQAITRAIPQLVQVVKQLVPIVRTLQPVARQAIGGIRRGVQVIRARRAIRRQRRSRANMTGKSPVSVPAALATNVTSTPVTVSNKTVNATEEFYTIKQTANGTLRALFPISPIQSEMFPRLSEQANQFQRYKFTDLFFTFQPTSNTAVSGQFVMGALSNPDDAGDYTSDELAALPGATRSTAWTTCITYVAGDIAKSGVKLMKEPDHQGGQPNPVKSPYQVGILHIAMEGVPTTIPVGTVLGVVRVTYTAELIDPVFNKNLPTGVLDCTTGAQLFDGAQDWLGETAPIEAIGNDIWFDDHHHPRIIALYAQGVNPAIAISPASTVPYHEISNFGNATHCHLLIYCHPTWGADMLALTVPGVAVVTNTRIVTVRTSAHSGLAP